VHIYFERKRFLFSKKYIYVSTYRKNDPRERRIPLAFSGDFRGTTRYNSLWKNNLRVWIRRFGGEWL